MYEIIEILPNGCIRVTDGGVGVPYIEAGDHERAKLLPEKDYEIVKRLWTPDLIAARQAELERQAQEVAQMFA